MKKTIIISIIIILIISLIGGCLSQKDDNSPPKAEAGEEWRIHLGDAVQFNGSGSSDPDKDELTYEWDFGDGSKGTGIIVEHTYNKTGIFNVTLTVKDREKSDADNIKVIVENNLPFAEAGGDQTFELGTEVHFNASGSWDKDNDSLTYEWDFGDGTLGSGITTKHTYDEKGTYTVILTVRDMEGNDTDMVNITIIESSPEGMFVSATFSNPNEGVTNNGGGWSVKTVAIEGTRPDLADVTVTLKSPAGVNVKSMVGVTSTVSDNEWESPALNWYLMANGVPRYYETSKSDVSDISTNEASIVGSEFQTFERVWFVVLDNDVSNTLSPNDIVIVYKSNDGDTIEDIVPGYTIVFSVSTGVIGWGLLN